MGILNFIFGNKRRNEKALREIEPLFNDTLKAMLASVMIYAVTHSGCYTVEFNKLIEGKKTFSVGNVDVEIEFDGLRVIVKLEDKEGSTVVIGANIFPTGEFNEPLGDVLAGLYYIMTVEEKTLEAVCSNVQCAYIVEKGIFGVGTAVATLQK